MAGLTRRLAGIALVASIAAAWAPARAGTCAPRAPSNACGWCRAEADCGGTDKTRHCRAERHRKCPAPTHPEVRETKVTIGGKTLPGYRVDLFRSSGGDEYVYVSPGDHLGVADPRGRGLAKVDTDGACCGGGPTKIKRFEFDGKGHVVLVAEWTWTIPVEGPERHQTTVYEKRCVEAKRGKRVVLACVGEP